MAVKKTSITSYIPKHESIGGKIRRNVYEMIGRSDTADKAFASVSKRYNLYKALPSFDITRTVYPLARAIFHASIVKDTETSKDYGRELILGAAFGKPIVNIAAGFAIGTAAQIVENTTDADAEVIDNPAEDNIEQTPGEVVIPKKEKENPTIKNVNQWLEEQRGMIFRYYRNGMRDGDNFIVMDDNGELQEISPEDVTVVQDPNTFGKIAGYNIRTNVTTYDDNGTPTSRTFLDEIRTTYRERFELTEGKKVKVPGTKIEFLDEVGAPVDEKLPVVHYANEREGRQLYGMSDYQSCIYYMMNYHALLESGIKGNIYNSTPVPVMKGIKNMNKFLELNFQKDDDGNYIIEWDQDKMLIGGEGFDADMLSTSDSASGTQIFLNILFWLICQTSETPEFAFGTAVQSSKASVSEQTPVLIQKALRKQSQMEQSLRQLIDLYIERMAKLKPDEFDADTQFTIKFPSILDEDLNINLQIVKTMRDEGIITSKTAAVMLNLGKYVKDMDEELIKAAQEKKERTPVQTDIFGTPSAPDSAEATQIDKVKKALADAKATDKQKVQEMKDKHFSTQEELEAFINEHPELTIEEIDELFDILEV